jgi:anti-sigma regulatory factor (Ser/Thr protein kinase)
VVVVEVAGGATALRPAAARIAVVAIGYGADPERHAELELAVHELLANALEHGHLGDPTVPIRVEVTGDGAGRVTVHVADRALDGAGDPTPCGSDEARDRGRGLLLAGAVGTVRRRTVAGCTLVSLELAP